METGLPHKTLLFTAWVGKGNRGEAVTLQEILAEAFVGTLGDAKRDFRWYRWSETGRLRLLEKVRQARQDRPEVAAALETLSYDELTSRIGRPTPAICLSSR